MIYYVTVSALRSYSAGYSIEANSIEEAREIALKDQENKFDERHLEYEPCWGDEFFDVTAERLETENGESVEMIQ